MKICAFFIVVIMILMVSSAYAAKRVPKLSPSPAPAPAPDSFHVNLTDLLSVAGPYGTFLSMLQSTNVIDVLQNQANNTEQGVTIFVPSDDAFSTLKKPSISNLTRDQLKSLLLFHALPKFYTFSDFQNLSQLSPVATFAGGPYTLNFTDDSGLIHIYSGWTTTKIGSSVLSTFPASIYEVGHVLLPEAIFGTAPPPAPAPAPALDTNVSDVSPPSQSPLAGTTGIGLLEKSPSGSSAQSCRSMSVGILLLFVLVIGCA